MRAITRANLPAVLMVLLGMFSLAKADDPKAVLDKLEKEYPFTTINAEGEVVTQGVLLKLKKGGLTASLTKSCPNEYKDGKIVGGGNMLSRCVKLPGLPGVAAAPIRPFVAGEKVSVTKIEMAKDGIAVSLISEPISDARYRAELKFPVQKGAAPDLAEADRMMADLFTVAPPEPAADQGQPADQAPPPAQTTAGAPAEQPLPAIAEPQAPAADPAPFSPIAPPPPPPDQPAPPPQTIGLGQTIDQVVAILGQPATVADVGTKKIYTYRNPNMKVTFVNGKVTDLQ